MKKIILMLILSQFALYAQVSHAFISQKLIDSGIVIVDIRTKAEWKQTGIIKGSYPIEFFNEQGRYNIPKFLKELKAVIKPNEKFALICNTGSRTKLVSQFLSQELKYNVIDLQGGIQYGISIGLPLVPYR